MSMANDLLTIDEVIAKYGHSRTWWFEQIRKGQLVAYDIAGKRETFLSEREVQDMLRPRPRGDVSGSGTDSSTESA